MAANGIRFTDYYAAAPICSPSRAGLLTGCYPRRIGLHTWVQRADSPLGIHEDERTMAELFRENGYATACIGKWHLGYGKRFSPRGQGFDSHFGLLHNLDPVETTYFKDEGGVPLVRNGKVVKRPADPNELTGLYTDAALKFLEEQKDNPFFLYLAHTMLHSPLGVSEAFRGTSHWGDYGDAIQELDHHTGRLFDKLDRLGIADRTWVLYASDNGRGAGRNEGQPYRGRKLTTLEAGIRVPAILWGPGIGSGSVSSDLVTAMDWFPTLASLAGIRIRRDRAIDGRDLSGAFTGRPGIAINRDLASLRPFRPAGEWEALFTEEEYRNAFFYHGAEGALAAVRSGDWKLFLTPELTLYNLRKDPSESRRVRNGPVLRKLRGMAIMFQEEMTLHCRPVGKDR
jgi:arylsulfatase A-like enzyme